MNRTGGGRLNKKGSAAVWLIFLVTLFTITMIYNFLSYPVSNIQVNVKGWINDTVTSQNSTIGEKALSTLNVIDIVWQYWPLLFIFGLIIWAFLASTRKEPIYEGFG